MPPPPTCGLIPPATSKQRPRFVLPAAATDLKGRGVRIFDHMLSEDRPIRAWLASHRQCSWAQSRAAAAAHAMAPFAHDNDHIDQCPDANAGAPHHPEARLHVDTSAPAADAAGEETVGWGAGGSHDDSTHVRGESVPVRDAAEDAPAAHAGTTSAAGDGWSGCAHNDPLSELLAERSHRLARDEQMRRQVHEEMSVRMDVGVRVNPALAALVGLSGGGDGGDDDGDGGDDGDGINDGDGGAGNGEFGGNGGCCPSDQAGQLGARGADGACTPCMAPALQTSACTLALSARRHTIKTLAEWSALQITSQRDKPDKRFSELLAAVHAT